MKETKGANGKPCKRLGRGHDCSCCGSTDNGEDFFVFRAGWCDSDGVYYPRLCGDGNGYGCIYEVVPAESHKNEAAQMLLDLMPGEADDGVVTMLEDMDYLGEFE